MRVGKMGKYWKLQNKDIKVSIECYNQIITYLVGNNTALPVGVSQVEV